MSVGLRIKSRVLGTVFDAPLRRLRSLCDVPRSIKHPELRELSLEEVRLPLVLRGILRENSCVLDVGAHLGSFLALAVQFAPLGDHAAIEASKQKSEWLARKFQAVRVFPVAAADRNGPLFFHEDINRPGCSYVSDVKTDGAVAVNAVRIDDLGLRRVDFIKLDVEGGELAALRGAGSLIARDRPAILFECGPERLLNANYRHQLYDFLTGAGYALYTFTDMLFPEKGPLGFDEFRKCGIYPFRAFNFLATVRPPSLP
jgi:FkbM family methyltransferase